ncbi:MAG: cobalamin-dependent protein [Ilumatobacter sp.]|uniref:cobalamin B12-binding domain-containing protein n=1 Tax=Ilumatobacter sp. TaxID=1967498 RepID=UPI002634DB74|nr:cobalamin-dependent protein [Ilumatobacter sp.]MDJ0767561.1 cobalamin-dependent protein [Ilumatobacter sp.]
MSVLLDEYTDAALRGDRAGAAMLATNFAGRDESCLDVVTQLLAPSQRDVGERWLRGECTVADEHSATFVTESVLSSLGVGLEAREPAGTVVMVCAEGEWHSLPARMATELMIAGGWRVIHLGPAMPAGQLRDYLADIEADVVGVSVTLASNLTGAARTVRAASQAGHAVMCGGRAFDSAGRRARAIGAHGQARDLTEPFVLDEMLWGEPLAVDMDADWAHLEYQRVEVVRDALSWLGTSDFADRVRSASWFEYVTAELGDVVAVGAAAMLCGDPTIVVQHRAWLEDRLAAVGTPVGVARDAFDAVAAVVDDRVPGASAFFV